MPDVDGGRLFVDELQGHEDSLREQPWAVSTCANTNRTHPNGIATRLCQNTLHAIKCSQTWTRAVNADAQASTMRRVWYLQLPTFMTGRTPPASSVSCIACSARKLTA